VWFGILFASLVPQRCAPSPAPPTPPLQKCVLGIPAREMTERPAMAMAEDPAAEAMAEDPTVTLMVHYSAWRPLVFGESDGSIEYRAWDDRGWPIYIRTRPPRAAASVADVIGALDALLPGTLPCPVSGTHGAFTPGRGFGFVWRRPDGPAYLYFYDPESWSVPAPEALPSPLADVLGAWREAAGSPVQPELADLVPFWTPDPMGAFGSCDPPSGAPEIDALRTVPRSALEACPDGCARIAGDGASRCFGLYARSSHPALAHSFGPYRDLPPPW
jgi:hypothetical protein